MALLLRTRLYRTSLLHFDIVQKQTAYAVCFIDVSGMFAVGGRTLFAPTY